MQTQNNIDISLLIAELLRPAIKDFLLEQMKAAARQIGLVKANGEPAVELATNVPNFREATRQLPAHYITHVQMGRNNGPHPVTNSMLFLAFTTDKNEIPVIGRFGYRNKDQGPRTDIIITPTTVRRELIAFSFTPKIPEEFEYILGTTISTNPTPGLMSPNRQRPVLRVIEGGRPVT